MLPAMASNTKIKIASLGPLFPRYVAVILSGLFIFVLSTLGSHSDPTLRLWTVVGSFLVILVMFGASAGRLNVNPSSRTILVRESLLAWAIHLWRPRSREFLLEESSSVLIGSWLRKSLLTTQGVRVIPKSGEPLIIWDAGGFLPGKVASRMATAIATIPNIDVRLVRLGDGDRLVDWTPQPTAFSSWKLPAAIFLNFSGLIAGLVIERALVLVVIGLAAGVIYLSLWYQASRMKSSPEGQTTSIFLLAFSGFRFALIYTVFVLIGRSMLHH